MRHLAILIVCAGLWVAPIMQQPAHPQSGQANLAVLYGARIIGSRITIDVASSGCTDESYFTVKLDPEAPDSYRLSILQQKEDRCRMSPHITTLTLDIPPVPNMAAAKFRLVNEVRTSTTLPRP
jgi:hypothetical protein